MSTLHTPGPWDTYADNTGLKSVVSTVSPEDGGNIICDAPIGYEASMLRWKANSNLIAAAPDMLEALEKICEMNYKQAEDQYGDRNKAKNWSCVRVAEAAITKAKGGAH